MKLHRNLLLALACSSTVGTVHALQGQPHVTHANCQVVTSYVYETGPPAPSTEDGSFDIIPIFDGTVSNGARFVIAEAIEEWEAVIKSAGKAPNSFNITFRFAALSGTTVGQASTAFNPITGRIVNNPLITFDNGTTFFIDPTPEDDFEYDELGMNGPDDLDLLSVARHEIGHTLGFLSFPPMENLIQNDVFDPNRINVPMTPGDAAHTDGALYPDDLMQPNIDAGQRRPIRPYFHHAVLARAWNHSMPIWFVDQSHAGLPLGTADFPWPSVVQGLVGLPPGEVLLIVPGSYDEATPVTIDFASGLVTVARGGGGLLIR